MLLPAAALLAASLTSSPVVQVGSSRSAMAEFGRVAPSSPYAHALQMEARRRAFWQGSGSREARLYARHRVLSCVGGDKSNCW